MGDNTMNPDPKKILDEALKLEPKTRAYVAEILLESLDFEEDFAVSKAWREELRRRCAEIDSGAATLLEGESVIAELRKKYS